MRLDPARRRTSPRRGRPADLPEVVDGRTLAIGSQPAVEALSRHRRVLEKSTATMQYQQQVNNSLRK